MMKKLDKKSIVIILILLVNISFITIPYTVKNYDMQGKIKYKKGITKKEKSIDFYKSYEEFNCILDELNIKYYNKKVDFSNNKAIITLEMAMNINTLSNLLIYLHKKIPDISILSADISNDINNKSVVVFCISE